MTVYYYLCHNDDICILLSKIVLYFVLECVGAIDGTHFSARTLSSKVHLVRVSVTRNTNIHGRQQVYELYILLSKPCLYFCHIKP